MTELGSARQPLVEFAQLGTLVRELLEPPPGERDPGGVVEEARAHPQSGPADPGIRHALGELLEGPPGLGEAAPQPPRPPPDPHAPASHPPSPPLPPPCPDP